MKGEHQCITWTANWSKSKKIKMQNGWFIIIIFYFIYFVLIFVKICIVLYIFLMFSMSCNLHFWFLTEEKQQFKSESSSCALFLKVDR